MAIRHPYSFVPFSEIRKRERGPGHDRFQAGSHSGRFRCTLTTKTLLCIKDHFLALQEKSKTPYVRGSSLKGMLRTMVQMLGAGCARGFHDEERDATEMALGSLEPCEGEMLCMACRLFGYTGEGATANSLASKVKVEDSLPVADWRPADDWHQMQTGAARWQAQDHIHKAFYYRDGKPAGWKIYRHGTGHDGAAPSFRSGACVGAEKSFVFPVHYENLDDEEFAMLRFALTLRYECSGHGLGVKLWHKLGYGKSIGLGSCEVVAVNEPLALRRYFGEPAPVTEAPICEPELEPYLRLPSFQKLQSFLAPERMKDTLRFPRQGWFLANSQKKIEDFENEMNSGGVTPPPPPPPPAELPKKLAAIITKKKNGFVTAEARWEGRVYRCKTRKVNLYHAKVGGECEIEVDVDKVKDDQIEGTIELL